MYTFNRREAKKFIPAEKSAPQTLGQRCLKNPASGGVATGHEGFGKDGSGPMTLSEKKPVRLDPNGCIFSTAGTPKS